MWRMILLAGLFVVPLVCWAEKITPHCTFNRGPINGVLIKRDGKQLAVYGWQREVDNPTKIQQVLLPHARRDLVWKCRDLVEQGATLTAPARERFHLERPEEFWDTFTMSRFHDYNQQSTKILSIPLQVEHGVKAEDTFTWQDLTFKVLETPGYTRGSVTYLTELDGKRIAFTGDLIYGDGKILDLYSFQDTIPAARVRGYHGYGARLADLVRSLQLVAKQKPDLLIPARGPVIDQPQAAIQKLISRVQALYHNYLSTNALHWYFKEERMRLCGQRVLGADAGIELMPYCRREQTPDWIFEHSTSRLLISQEGHGFLLDCGYQRVIDAVQELIDKKVIKQVDGIFVTHFHDDHTDMVQAAAETFGCPVYATEEYADVLEHPEAYHLPAMTSNPIKNIQVMKDGQKHKWQEFDLTFHFYPGQTYYHGGLFVEKPKSKPAFFIGDSFAPSGIDDYCVLNRNLVHRDTGYLYCLEKLKQIQGDYWLVNQHIQHVFTFSPKELDYLETRYQQRIRILQELFPWDDPNYGIDQQWAVFYPYGTKLRPGATTELQVRLTNHSPTQRTFTVVPHAKSGLKLLSGKANITLDSRASGTIKVRIQAPENNGNFLVTTDVLSDGMEFREWTEALITVE